ncbi:hypothetical protein MBLNU13_g04338t1 [Cladosporium sp. NU13]
MNLMPGNVDLSTLTKVYPGQSFIYVQHFVVAAFVHCKPDLNFRDSQTDFVNYPFDTAKIGQFYCAYGPVMIVKAPKSSRQTQFLAAYYRPDLKELDRSIRI